MCTRLPYTMRGLVLDFLCADLDALYAHLCTVKANAYHTLEKPVFWYPRDDWEDVTNAKPDARAMLTGVYSHVVERYHKPKLSRLKRALVKHHKFVKQNKAMRGRTRCCRQVLQILDVMLRHDVEVARALFAPAQQEQQ